MLNVIFISPSLNSIQKKIVYWMVFALSLFLGCLNFIVFVSEKIYHSCKIDFVFNLQILTNLQRFWFVKMSSVRNLFHDVLTFWLLKVLTLAISFHDKHWIILLAFYGRIHNSNLFSTRNNFFKTGILSSSICFENQCNPFHFPFELWLCNLYFWSVEIEIFGHYFQVIWQCQKTISHLKLMYSYKRQYPAVNIF